MSASASGNSSRRSASGTSAGWPAAPSFAPCAQINPHFLFNALNAIAGLIPDQPQLADETVEQLAQVFRYTLRKSEKEWARLDEEVEFAAAYLRVEQARFGERLRVEFQVDPSTDTIQVPAMSIQPLIENAVKHGVSAVEGRGTVGLRARRCSTTGRAFRRAFRSPSLPRPTPADTGCATWRSACGVTMAIWRNCIGKTAPMERTCL
jgi:hypothetical protein